jgi:hypothetical protein
VTLISTFAFAADPNITSANAQALSYITDNGPLVIGVVVAAGLFTVGTRWVRRLLSKV